MAHWTITAATRNKNKLAEIWGAVGDTIEILPCPDNVPDVDETADTLLGNARLKAYAVSAAIGRPAVSDDTGLEVVHLNGAPGVYSARFSGPGHNSRRNCELVLARMDGVPSALRSARYRTVAVAVFPDGTELVAEGVCEGDVAEGMRGDGGFGYDPIFVPSEAGDGRTFAEMSPEEKVTISHRARAFREMAKILKAHAPRGIG